MSDETQPASQRKTPYHLWVVGIIAFLWSAMGAMDFVMTQTQNTEYMKQFTSEQLDFFYGFPLWVNIAWAVAVWGGVIGAILLLLKSRHAVIVFTASFAAMLITMFHNYVLSNGLEVVGDGFALAFTAVIVIAALLFMLYSRRLAKQGVLK